MRGFAQRDGIARGESRRDWREFPISGPDERVREIARKFSIAIDRIEQGFPVDRVRQMHRTWLGRALDSDRRLLDRGHQTCRAGARKEMFQAVLQLGAIDRLGGINIHAPPPALLLTPPPST